MALTPSADRLFRSHIRENPVSAEILASMRATGRSLSEVLNLVVFAPFTSLAGRLDAEATSLAVAPPEPSAHPDSQRFQIR